MNKAEKEAVVQEVEAKLRETQTAIITDYRGLTVQEIAELRRNLRQEGVEYKVYKNTLIKRAVDKLDIKGLDDFLKGPTALALSRDDPVAPAKVLAAFAKEKKSLSIKGGLVEGSVIDAASIKALAKLPSREVLLGKLAGILQAPLSGLVSVLNGPARGLAAALNQVAEQKK